jgi:hypothetical protein
VREGAHVARALDIILSAQRVHADAGAPDVARRHRKVGDRHDGRAALAVLGDAEAVIDAAVAARREHPGRPAHRVGGDAAILRRRLGRMFLTRDEFGPVVELVEIAALADEFLID